jgi:photosystem II stability/assembly factor-like uncharacterized protein
MIASPQTRRIALLLAATLGLPVSQVGADDRRAPAPPLTRRDRLYDVAFVGKQAWVVGFPGIIRHTRDGGASWTTQRGGGKEALFAVHFADARRGWIVGRGGLVLATLDGGKRWTRQKTPTAQHLFAVHFLEGGKEGWAVGSFGVVLRTTDGGKRWTQVKVVLQQQAAEEPKQGTTGAATEQEEEDFGEGAWGGSDDPYGVDGRDSSEPGDGASAKESGPSFDRHLNGVWVLGPGRAIAAGESGKIIATTDGGASWQPRESGVWAPLYQILFVSPRQGFIGGGVGTLLRTDDGGTTWRPLATGEKAHLFALTRRGHDLYAVGSRGTLLRQRGERFQRVPLGIYGWLSALAFGGDNVGLLVGGQGRILRTTDGGQRWRCEGAGCASDSAD